MTEPDQDAGTGIPGEYGLLMPFVVTVSHGGPFEDRSFVAGYQAGLVDRMLAIMHATGIHRHTVTCYTDLLPQIDLLAMEHGFACTVMSYEGELAIWSTVTFEEAGAVPEAGS